MPVNNALTPEGSNALGAAFGYYPQLRRNRQFNDREASAEMPLQFMRSRLASTMGTIPDLMNLKRSLLPAEAVQALESYGKIAPEVPYGSQYFQENLPLPPQGPAQQMAGAVGSVVPLSPAEILQAARLARQATLAGGKVAQKGARLVGEELNATMLGERPNTLLGAVTPQPMFASPPSKVNLTPSLQIDGKVLPVTMHRLEEKAGNQIVNINPKTFDQAFSKTQWQYVGKGGEGGIEGRYKGFENWLKDAKSMTASNVSVNKDGGIVFGDGRHRYAVLRDMGLDKLPISMDKDSIKNAKKFGYIADENSFQYPQQEALRLAQDRASLPVEQGGLGLPKDNTPEMRAQAMGFDLNNPQYHATDVDFSSIRPSIQGKLGAGVYVSPSSPYAEKYTSLNAAGNARVLPLVARGNLADDDVAMNISESIRKEMAAQNPNFSVSEWKKRTTQALADAGYDGRSMSGLENVITNPSNLRSRFATFDPFRKDVATATAMGVLAPDLLAAQQDPYSQNEMRKFMRQGR
jgi:hypothetical protein